jgi:hypothetical protein
MPAPRQTTKYDRLPHGPLWFSTVRFGNAERHRALRRSYRGRAESELQFLATVAGRERD